jgi:hypothetical protein
MCISQWYVYTKYLCLVYNWDAPNPQSDQKIIDDQEVFDSAKSDLEDYQTVKKERSEIESCTRNIKKTIVDLTSNSQAQRKFQANSIWFTAVLLGAIIFSFFYLVKTSNASGQIFSGSKGLQYVALFMIIVSITILGLIDTFGPEELSALLGSIAGYILGRVGKDDN